MTKTALLAALLSLPILTGAQAATLQGVTDTEIVIGTANNEPGHWFLSQAAIDSANSATNPTTAAP